MERQPRSNSNLGDEWSGGGGGGVDLKRGVRSKADAAKSHTNCCEVHTGHQLKLLILLWAQVGPPRPLPGIETPAMLRQRLKSLLADQFPQVWCKTCFPVFFPVWTSRVALLHDPIAGT